MSVDWRRVVFEGRPRSNKGQQTRDKLAIVGPRSKLQDRDLARERVRVKFRKEIIAVIKPASLPLTIGEPCGVRSPEASITKLINHYLSRDSFFIISRQSAATQGAQMRFQRLFLWQGTTPGSTLLAPCLNTVNGVKSS